MEGGIPKGHTILVTGGAGTGKTIFGIQFVDVNLKNGKKCAIVTLGQEPPAIPEQGGQFNKLTDIKTLDMISAKTAKFEFGKGPKALEYSQKITLIKDRVLKMKPDIVVIDPITALSIEAGAEARTLIKMLTDKFREIGATTILIGEAVDGGTLDGLLEYIVDGVIVMSAVEMGSDLVRNISVKKMRMTKITGGAQKLEFTSNGLKVTKS
jgi:KaiC/GvpD/RAD55 family RecA-like ATPase